MYVFKVWDSKTEQYTEKVYRTVTAAKSSFSTRGGSWRSNPNRIKFDDQDRYVLHKFKLVREA